MPAGQEDIYYITGRTYEEASKSPYLEAFREKDYEVLIMLDEIDDFIMGGLLEYKGKKLRSVVKGAIDLEKDGTSEKEKAKGEFEKLIDYIREILRDDVKDVRLSGRLKDSACCLVTEEGGLDPNMEKILTAMGQEVPAAKRILEINPSHPVLGTMKEILEKEGRAPVLREYAELLYDQALLLEGSRPKDPASFVKSVAKLMVDNARQGTA
jgi:molecular chaperone HtpG